MQIRPTGFNVVPDVIKNLLIINVLVFLATASAPALGIDLYQYLSLFHFSSDYFKPYQLVTHLFMHGGTWHLIINMFMLWMFGSAIENLWGGKRFLIYYTVCGIGAALLHMFVSTLEINSAISEGQRSLAMAMANIPTVGASGAVYGILLAYGMTFPNNYLILLFPPIPIKAKYLVLILGAMELYTGIQNNPTDNVAHFAHLGGMIFGFLLIKHWRRRLL